MPNNNGYPQHRFLALSKAEHKRFCQLVAKAALGEHQESSAKTLCWKVCMHMTMADKGAEASPCQGSFVRKVKRLRLG